MGLTTIVNDLNVLIIVKTTPILVHAILTEIPPSASHTFVFGDVVAETLVLEKQGQTANVPFYPGNQVVYASQYFITVHLQTIINDIPVGPVTAEVQVVAPGNPVKKSVELAPETSYTFSLGPLGVRLVLKFRGSEVTFPIDRDGGKQVGYASQYFVWTPAGEIDK